MEETKMKKVIALENMESFPHTWTKGLDYEIVEKNGYFTLASNEGSANWMNTVKDDVLKKFIVEGE
jgi:hypothetical protein